MACPVEVQAAGTTGATGTTGTTGTSSPSFTASIVTSVRKRLTLLLWKKSCRVVALLHLRAGLEAALHGVEQVDLLALGFHLGHDGQRVPQRGGRQHRAVALDHALVAHALQPPVDRRGRQVHPLAQLALRHAAVGLDQFEQAEVEGVERGHG
jgi:hypothetical protein